MLFTPYLGASKVKASYSSLSSSPALTETPDDGNGEEDLAAPDWSGATSSTAQKPTQQAIGDLIADMRSRRIGGDRVEQTLPRIGMSQCDQKLVKEGKIDERVLESLNYLVKPVTQGGAGMTYLHVTFSKACEEDVPELIGGAYPVVFEGETPDPNNPGYPLLQSQPNTMIIPKSSGSPTSTSSNSIKSVVGLYAQQQYQRFSDLSKIIAPLASASSTNKSVDVEPPGVEAVHQKGQAADIMAAGLVMCVTKSGGIAGFGAKATRQAPRPIQVAWQTDKGVSNVNTPFGANFDQMANSAGLDDFLEGFTSQDGTFRSQALQGAFTMMGFNLIANQLGIKPGTFDPDTAPLNYQTIGYAMLADLMDLPDASVFDPLANDGIDPTNPLQTRRDNVDTLLRTSLIRKVEKDLSLPSGSLDGDTVEDVMTNAAKRRLEKDMGLMPRSLSINLDNPDDLLRSIGQAKMESFYHLPTGSANTGKINNTNIIGGMIDNTASMLRLSKEQKPYAESLIRASLNLPSNISLGDLTNPNSNYWKDSNKSKTLSEQLQSFDRQLYSKEQSLALTSPGAISIIDDIQNGNIANLTFRMLTNNMPLAEYQKFLGLGALLNQYGIYSFTNTENTAMGLSVANGKAVDFPQDQAKYGLVKGHIVDVPDGSTVKQIRSIYHDPYAEIITIGAGQTRRKGAYINGTKVTIDAGESVGALRSEYNDPNAIIVTPPRNEFLTNLLRGDQNYWVALGVNVLAKSLQMNPDERLKIVGNGRGGEARSGMVADALAGNRDFRFSSSRANISINLSPSDFLTLIGANLAKNKSATDAKKLANQRQEALSNLAKERFGYSFSQMASKAIGDRELLNLLYTYDQSRPSIHDTDESFHVTDSATISFRLSNRAVEIKSLEMTDYDGAPLVSPQYTLSSDGNSVSLPADTFKSIIPDVTVKITYTTYARKAGQASQITPDLFQSLFNDKDTLSNIAIKFGAAKMSLAMNLPSNSLGFAASLLDPKTKGVKGVGQASLEQSAGLPIGTLSGGTIKELIATGKITRDQLNRMFLLEAGWYDKIASGDTEFITINSGVIAATDEYYKIEYGSTVDLLTNKITLDEYKKRIGQSNLRYNMGGVLASRFSLQVMGYRLKQEDFYDILNGNLYLPLLRVGARAQERNHNLPINSLATVLISGQSNDALRMLASNVVASAFHLKSLNLDNVNSIAQVKESIGRSTIEQALGFGDQSFIDGNALEVARRVGAEKFASAFGFVLPQSVNDQLSNIKYAYHSDLLQKDRDTVIYNYLSTILLAGSGLENQWMLNKSTLSRFEAIDYSLGIEKGSTKDFILGTINSNAYIAKTGEKAVSDGVSSQLASLIGVPDSYVFMGRDILEAIRKNKIDDLKNITGGWGGKFVDAQVGWTDGTFKKIIDNSNNSAMIKSIITHEGSKRLAKMTGLEEEAFTEMFGGNFGGASASIVSSKINIAGFTDADALNLFNGHFTDGVTLIGAAKMSTNKEMREAGISYNDLRASVYGDPVAERNTIIDLVVKDNPGMNPATVTTEQENAWVFDATKQNFHGQSYVETARRNYMSDARQNVSFKYLDYQAKQLIPAEYARYLQPGFARALVGGTYSYTDVVSGKRIDLNGDAARWRYAKDFFTNYAVNNIPILQGMSLDTAKILSDYATSHSGDDQWLESALQANNGRGFAELGKYTDNLVNKVFKIDFAPGTGAALIGYSFNGDVTKLKGNLWSAWQFKAFNWADDALGMPNGTASLMYQGVTSYQSALSTYRQAAAEATKATAIAAGNLDSNAIKSASKQMDSASRQFKTQTAMIIASVANVVFQKQFSQIETALGLAPGTVIYLIQYFISPDPVTLGLFIFFNFVWGRSSTKCAIDKYPDGDPLNMTSVIQSQATLMQNLINSAASTISVDSQELKTSASPIDKKLLPPSPFKADNNDTYRTGIKAGAQYEVRRTIGSLLIMPLKTGNSNLKPLQIGTLSEEDVNLFEPISSRADLYGPLTSRPEKIGPGWYEKTVDRIHLGY